MFIDTHCHLNIMVKKTFDTLLTKEEVDLALPLIQTAQEHGVTSIINVGTSLAESTNCITLAHRFPSVYAAIGIHPNDCTATWRNDLALLKKYAAKKEDHKIVAIGECGLDFHYPDFNVQQQKDAFRAQIELALEYDLALIVHTRQAHEETLNVIDEYHKDITKGVIHCFSEDQSFADTVIGWGFVLGIGGTLTYPKNNDLRSIFTRISLDSIVLETDAPFLPPQAMRGKQNSPAQIATIAHYLAQLRNESVETVAQVTTASVKRVFGIS